MILEIIQIFLIFILPVILVYFKIIPFKYRRHTLVVISFITIALCVIEEITLEQLGIRTDNMVSSILPYLIFTILGIVALIVISKIIKKQPQSDFYTNKKFILIILIGSILQEFLYRGFLFPKLQAVFSNYIILLLVNAVLFAFVHIVYSNTLAILITIFIGGIFFAGIYFAYPNLILVAISHIILNHVALRYNFFREENTKNIIKRVKPDKKK